MLRTAALALALAVPQTGVQELAAAHRHCVAADIRGGSDPDAAIAACTSVIDSRRLRDKDLAFALYKRGQLFASAKADPDAAMGDYTRAIAVSPEPGLTAGIYMARATVQMARGQIENGLADYSASLTPALDPRLRPHALAERGIANMLVARRGAYSAERRAQAWKQAEEDLDQAVQLSPRHARALYARGVLRKSNGRTVEGDADMDAARTLDPAIPPTLARLGLIVAPFAAR